MNPALEQPREAWAVTPVIAWLLSEGRLNPDPLKLIDALATHLLEAGAPVWRLRFAFFTIHPQVAVWAWTWVRGRETRIERIGHGVKQTDAYIGSPAQRLFETGTAVRYRLDRLAAADHRLLHELAALGGADYLMLPLRFSDGSINVFAIATDDARGYAEHDLANFSTLSHALAPVLEVAASRRVAETLLDTYVGPRTGGRVLRGQIRRGDGETIHAALWYADLRGFTAASETLSAPDLLALLNTYFETIAVAVTARGGEILRFIGDAMLVVFTAQSPAALDAACRAALDAALDAFAGLAHLNARRRLEGKSEIHFGVGLNEGEVVYGNVGAPERLDFTVIGPAVNRTARLEELTKRLGVPLLMSATFAARLDVPARSLGFYPMRGVAQPQEVYGLEELGGTHRRSWETTPIAAGVPGAKRQSAARMPAAAEELP